MPNGSSSSTLVLKRQLVPASAFLVLFTFALAVLYITDRHREWALRKEQASHRLELAFELVTRDLERVGSDILNLAHQHSIQNNNQLDGPARRIVETEFVNFLRFKPSYYQMRLLDKSGDEKVRVDSRDNRITVTPPSELQNKKDRSYFQESPSLNSGDMFVSEFDLNQEHGEVEKPIVPVIRFMTPVSTPSGKLDSLLVANYFGEPLLRDLNSISLPGRTLVIREDGQYLLGLNLSDAWGWMLGHRRSFASQFPAAWQKRERMKSDCLLTPEGAFSIREIEMQRFGKSSANTNRFGAKLLLVSYLPRSQVFETSNRLLNRLLVIGGVLLLPLFLLSRLWAKSSVRRQQQNLLILESEKKLRELSTRLVRIQEEERREISREIHDQLGQQVTAINLDLKLAHQDLLAGKSKIQLKRAIEESEQLLSTLHQLAFRVRPVELDDLGLADAVESHLWEFMDRTKIEVQWDCELGEYVVPHLTAENIYRLIQEALNNVLKHSNASRVAISIRQVSKAGNADHANQNALQVEITDNGIGNTTKGKSTDSPGISIDGNSRLGVLGMRERIDLLGGTFELSFGAEGGTTVRAVVPIDEIENTVNEKSKRQGTG